MTLQEFHDLVKADPFAIRAATGIEEMAREAAVLLIEFDLEKARAWSLEADRIVGLLRYHARFTSDESDREWLTYYAGQRRGMVLLLRLRIAWETTGKQSLEKPPLKEVDPGDKGALLFVPLLQSQKG